METKKSNRTNHVLNNNRLQAEAISFFNNIEKKYILAIIFRT